jgi:predicted aspartyl protease
MRDEMGTFRVDIELENPARPGAKRVLAGVLVDTGAELSWVPAEVLESLGVTRNNRWRFRQADGTVLERWTGSVLIRVLGKHAADEVVFGEPGDLVLLGARTLEGLNYRVEPVTRRLVDAGPAPAATVAPATYSGRKSSPSRTTSGSAAPAGRQTTRSRSTAGKGLLPAAP